MKRYFRYVGETTITGFSRPDGSEVLLHYGEVYELDDEEPFIRTLIAKRDGRGMPKPWLVEVEVPAASTQELNNESGEEQAKSTATQPKNKR